MERGYMFTHTHAYITGQFSCVGGVHDVRSVWDAVVVMELLFTFPVAELRAAEEVKEKRRSYSDKTNINKVQRSSKLKT